MIRIIAIIKCKHKMIQYTLKHKIAFLTVERKLLGKNTLRGYLHDTDKIFYYVFMSKPKASELHKSYARHHKSAKTRGDYLEMIIDWECDRYTKADKPLTARETLNAYYPERSIVLEPLLKELNL